MAGKYQSYSECKNSGVEWLGDIPAGWQTQRLGALLQERGEANQGPVTDNILSVLKDVGVIPYDEKGDIGNKKSDDIERYKIVHPGDLVVNSMNVIIGSVGVSKYFGALSPVYLVLHARDKGLLHPTYLGYIFQIKTFQRWLKRLGYGILDHRLRIPMDNLKKEFLPLPPPKEQRTIAAFLDHETARIDRLIEKQRRLIELLKEKRQAVISHAVTKGLDPNVPMKDSGVEWLGQVPEHWVVCRLKHVKHPRANSFVDGPFGSNLKSEHFISEGDVYVIESNFATTGLLMPSKLKTISEDHFLTIKRSEAEEGDIIIAKIGARYGSSAILPSIDKKAVVSGNSLKLTINKEICLVEYANLLLRHLKNEEAMDDGVNVTAQPALSLGALNNLPFLAPPLDEQSKILSYIDQTSELFDKIISKSELSIQLSGERRTALISAAVTGKIDVRNWQPNTSTQTAEPDLPMAAEQAAEYRV